VELPGGCSLLYFTKEYFLPDLPVIAEKFFWKGGGNYW
jgi:hypothetical protein